MAIYIIGKRKTLVVLSWNSQAKTGYATDQLKRETVYISHAPFRIASGMHQGCQINCVVNHEGEATEIRFPRPEERLNPIFRELGTVKWVHPRRLWIDLAVSIDRIYSLDLPRDTIIGHRSYKFSPVLQEMLEDGVSLFGHEMAFDAEEYDGRTVAANLTPVVDADTLLELAEEFAQKAAEDLPVVAKQITGFHRGRREVEFVYQYGDGGTIHRVPIYMNSDHRDLIHQLRKELTGYYHDYSIYE